MKKLYELIKYGKEYKFKFSMTFYGGLFGGVVGFFLMYFLYYKKHNDGVMNELLIIAPGCITIAHAFGRIGCFLAGCCYGKETTSAIGINFPGLGKRIPTQLIEAIFLFILTGILVFIIFKTSFKWTLHLYLASYSIFRFVIEFFRGDAERGGSLFGLYPSQIVCVFIWIIFIPTFFILKKYIFNKVETNEEK